MRPSAITQPLTLLGQADTVTRTPNQPTASPTDITRREPQNAVAPGRHERRAARAEATGAGVAGLVAPFVHFAVLCPMPHPPGSLHGKIT